MAILKNLLTEESGQGLTEYGLIALLVAIALIGSLVAFREKVAAVFPQVTTGLEGTVP